MHTYVFDFYNLYIPRGKQYINEDLCIRIVPLKYAEIFEKERTKINNPHAQDAWKTAKCYIRATNRDEALKLADWLEWLYSFAQKRSVFFNYHYEYGKGKKYPRFYYKHIELIENRHSDLIHGINTHGVFFTRDITFFIDYALAKLNTTTASKCSEIIKVIHAYLVSHSDMITELQFLICWISLERLANENSLNKKLRIFTEEELKKIKDGVSAALEDCVKDRNKLSLLKRNILRSFLYERNTYEKVRSYLGSLDLGFDSKNPDKVLTNLVEIRTKLVHNLNSQKLMNKPQMLFILQKIMEIVILRLLGFNKQLQNKLLLNQYNLSGDL
ncbi:hypothetical protein HYU16_02115 [Candidatus Woesearchaeota archaeon]|nr:hypothetical protein [Candidatus Woesearchaeota archaeon]